MATNAITVTNCYTSNSAGAFYLDGITLTDTGSTYSNLGGLKGGAFYLTNGAVLNLNSPTINNLVAYDGGVFYLVNSFTANLNTLTVTNIEARNNGGFVHTSTPGAAVASSLTFTNLNQITNLTAGNNGGAYYLDHSLFTLNSIVDVRIT